MTFGIRRLRKYINVKYEGICHGSFRETTEYNVQVNGLVL